MRTATIVFKFTIDEERWIKKINENAMENDQSTVEGMDWDGYVEDVIGDMMSGVSNAHVIDGEPGTHLKEDAEEMFHISTEWVD
jgi:hypothetical protein